MTAPNDLEAQLSPPPQSSFASLPAIFSHLRRKTGLKPSRNSLHATSYLDGVRGLAAFAVYWHHHHGWVHGNGTRDGTAIESAFGSNGDYNFATFPGIRYAFTGGPFSVALFFVVSGYVLSLRPLQAVHTGDSAKLAEGLASGLFRRWLRLYIPVIAITVSFLTLWYVPGTHMTKMILEGSWSAELGGWFVEFSSFSYVFQRKDHGWWFSYGYYMWTIPFEFQGSVVTYASILAFSRFSRNARLCCQIVLMIYFLYIADGWQCAMFLAGNLLCDLDLLAENKNLPEPFAKAKSTALTKPFFYALFALGVFLSGVPNAKTLPKLRASPGWHYLSYLKAPSMNEIQTLYHFLGGAALIACITHMPLLKAFFESRFCQYLGRVSFGLYLLHGPVLWTLGEALYLYMNPDLHAEENPGYVVPPRAWPLGFEPNLLLPHFVLLPVTFALAELATRFVDEPSVLFSRWLYKRLLGESSQSSRRRNGRYVEE